jgi:ADP-ribosylglycohydrolase
MTDSGQPGLRSRYRGALLGLAAGDALGTTLEFKPPGTFAPIDDMVGGGPFDLEPGQWTDDTSLMLCLAESLLEKERFDAVDQLERYVCWWREGYLSSTGTCFDIGNTTSAALARFERTREPFPGPTDQSTAGNGSLMRLAPVPLVYAFDVDKAIRRAASSSATTHGARAAVDACRYMAGLLVGALSGAPKDELLSPRYCPVPGYWQEHPLCPEVDAVADGAFRYAEPPVIRGTGYVVRSLEAALWAFHRGGDYREGALLAVNLGDDADTTGAVYGQLAGAYFGEEAIPEGWRSKLSRRNTITRFADRLLALRRTLEAEALPTNAPPAD